VRPRARQLLATVYVRRQYCLALSTVTALLATAPGLVTTFAGPLASGAFHLG